MDAGVPALLVLVVSGAIDWSLFRKLGRRPRGSSVETSGIRRKYINNG
jgi:hypothetical protein